VVESGGLENRCGRNPSTEGSNPSPSAVHARFAATARGLVDHQAAPRSDRRRVAGYVRKMTEDMVRAVGRCTAAIAIGLIAIVLGGSAVYALGWWALSAEPDVNPVTIGYVWFLGGGAACAAVALALLVRVLPAWVGRHAPWDPLWALIGLATVIVSWIFAFFGVVTLGAS
jgi:hypothetical protein